MGGAVHLCGANMSMDKWTIDCMLDRAIKYLQDIKNGVELSSFAWGDLHHIIDGLKKDIDDHRRNK